MKRVFYFNITYGCNSNCVFCYSHNTRHNSKAYNELSFEEFKKYIYKNKISKSDRVIINGGEPLLHTEIEEILSFLLDIECEVLIYTNGRLLNKIDFKKLNSNYRFIVPIHGYEKIHDKVTKVEGSFKETVESMETLKSNTDCKLDIKFILNNEMIKSEYEFKKTLDAFENIYFNNAVHLTKMADTIISEKNNCPSIENEVASKYMKCLYEYFSQRNYIVKIFDTCIKDMEFISLDKVRFMEGDLEVYYKDFRQDCQLILQKPQIQCMQNCDKEKFCMSAVGEYTVLEIFNEKIYENLE